MEGEGEQPGQEAGVSTNAHTTEGQGRWWIGEQAPVKTGNSLIRSVRKHSKSRTSIYRKGGEMDSKGVRSLPRQRTQARSRNLGGLIALQTWGKSSGKSATPYSPSMYRSGGRQRRVGRTEFLVVEPNRAESRFDCPWKRVEGLREVETIWSFDESPALPRNFR